jgi:hypothetical protein
MYSLMVMKLPKSQNRSAYTVLKPFRAKTSEGDKELAPGTTLNLTQEKAAGLVHQGLIAPDRPHRILIKWRTESGRFIYLAGSILAASAVPLGQPVFLFEELEAMRGLDRQAVEKIIDAKEVFPGCSVEKTDEQIGAVAGFPE